jgi:hypothetical protein
MKMATAAEFFEHLIGKYGDTFSSASGDATGHWENVKLRAPEAAAKMRQVSNELPAVEMAATLASLVKGPSFPRYDIADAWHSLLVFHEHTADSDTGWPGYFSREETDWNNIAHYAAAVGGFSNTEQLFRKILERIGPGHGSSLLLVFNGLSWPRSGLVHVERIPAELREGTLTIVDLATGADVPYEDIPGTRRQIVFMARDVPSIGYRMYSIRKGKPATARGEFSIDVKLDVAGALTSITDKSGREMFDPKAGRPFGALFIARNRRGFQLESAAPAEVKVDEGMVRRRVELARKGSPLPLTVITTYRDEAYIDFQFDVDLNFYYNGTGENQQYAIALPVPDKRQMFVDGAGFVFRGPQDLLPGGGAARYTPVHFIHLQQASDWGLTLANKDSAFVTPDLMFPVATDGRIAKTREEGTQLLFRTEPRGTPVESFHFRIASQPERKEEWERFGDELNLPLRAVFTGGPSEQPTRSFFAVNRREVQLLAFKPAQFRDGWYVLRFQEISGSMVNGVKLSTPLQITGTVTADIVEQPTGARIDLSNFSLNPWESLTVLCQAK